MSAKVKVAVRVRPMNKREKDMNAMCVVDMEDNQTILQSFEKRKPSRTFAFDHCFWTMDPSNPKYADQEQVFQALGMDILENSFEGYNACIFAYGQTGSGKSYTMMGSLVDETTKGIIPRLCDTLFDKIAQNEKPRLSFKVEVSYMEIYCEKVKDLLCPKGGKSSLKVREHKSLGPYVENLSKLAVRSFKDINDLMSEGNKSRTVAATQMNTESSRSHAVFSIVLTQTEFDPASQSGTEKVSKISLVDLAGSERVSKTGALGERLKEGSLINKSLTTLGLVISALADISAGKKPKNSYIPYRDSTLTWLLKDNLGGNSKTVMVATVSPASDNFEETLSTLRYADRAKRIVNHAVINEDPNSRVIRELREEVEKLRSLIGSGGGGGGGGAGSAANTKEISELQERLKISESLMTEMSKSWEQKLAETQRIHQERQKALEDMGISVQEAGIGVQVDKFYMVNLNADPSLNELLVCYLKPLTRIGRAQAQVPQDIVLRGLGIANEHCIIEIEEKNVFITPVNGARTLVNGVPVLERVQVRHGGRILLGNNHLYRLSCPHASGEEQAEEGSELMDYEQAMKEISINELTNDPLYSKVQENLSKKHEEEKEGALAAQRQKYEEQLAKLKEQLETTSAVSPTPPKHKYTTIEEEWEEKNRERLIKSVLQANRLVQEANMLAEALHKDTVFKVTLTVPRSYLSPTQHVESQDTTNEVAIRVLHKQRGTDSVWTTDTLEEKVLTMREMYERMEEGGSLLDDTIGPDPFYDLEQHALLGVANFYLECLNHDDIVHDYTAPIVAPTGKVCGKLRVAIQRLPAMLSGRDDDVDVPEIYVPDDSVDIGSRITVQVKVLEASGLPKEYSHYVFCQYQFWKEEQPMIIPPLVQTGLDKLSEKVQRFEHEHVFNVEITEEFLDYLEEGALAVEVWGHRRSGFNELAAPAAAVDEAEAHRHKSFPERWNELTKHIELVVEMMELSEQGEYVPVEIQSKPEVTTGGVFMIRQGQSRRINVVVRELDGAGTSPLQVDHISSVAMGSMYLRNRYDEPLTSLQKDDLQRLRTKWSNALMNRREYLDAEVRKMMDKREQSVSDLEKQNELLDQWAMLQWQRAAVLQPKVGSGVPGAPSNWNFPSGFEMETPVLFLDLNDDLLTPCDEDPEGAIKTGELFGEKPETMISLPIISSDNSGKGTCQATASWDSTVHNTNSLNKITSNNDRVYGIIKVTVVLQHPPGLELELRKRICLRVYKKMGFRDTFMRAFTTKDNRSTCGVLYEVVTGIPKSEGMDPPPKIPANPSFVELDEDENAVEKFKTAMTSVSSILHLDKLKQDVALKEKLTISGKSIRKRITVGEATPQSLSRADSGIIYPGSQGDSPTPPEAKGSGVEEGTGTAGKRGQEECTTVGSKAVALSNGSPHSDMQHRQDEEALGVGGETGARLDVIMEVEHSSVGLATGESGQMEGDLDEEAMAVPLTMVAPERGQLSENPETGQSEVVVDEAETARIRDQLEPQQAPVRDQLEPEQTPVRDQQDLLAQPGNQLEPQVQVKDQVDPQAPVKDQVDPLAPAKDQVDPLAPVKDQVDPLAPMKDQVDPLSPVRESELEQFPGRYEDTQQEEEREGERKDQVMRDQMMGDSVDQETVEAVKEDVGARNSQVTGEHKEHVQRPGEQQAGPQSSEQAGPQSSEQAGPQASEQTGPQTSEQTGPQTIEQTGRQASEQAGPQTSEQTGPQTKSQTSELAGQLTEQQRVEHPAAASESSEVTSEHKGGGVEDKSEQLIPLVQVSAIVNSDKPEVMEQALPATSEEGRCGPGGGPPSSPQARASSPSPGSSPTPRSSSPTPSTSSESSSVAEGPNTSRLRKPSPPPCSLNEKVMVEIGGGFKMGMVKFIGETEFATGEWIGVALDKPHGKHNGTVKGVKYFKCKDKHGVFVKRDKILHQPSGASPSSLSTKPPSPLTMKRRVTSNPQLSKSLHTSSGRRTSYGPGRR